MRIITGDECGLLKETIPELSRPSKTNNDNKLSLPASDEGVSRINDNTTQQYRQSRSRGVVGLAFLPSLLNDGDDDENDDEEEENGKSNTNKKFHFAALRVNGSVESWEGNVNGSKNAGEYCLTSMESSNAFAESETTETENDDELKKNEAEKRERKKSELFTASRPISIMSPYTSSSSIESSSTTPILACCDSWGRLSILNPLHNNNNKSDENDGIVARYNAFGKNNTTTTENAKISILKGNAPNSDVATACVIDSLGKRIAVGGRERETVLLDVETGKYLWKAKNLPPDPQTLLQHPIWSSSIQFLTSSSFSDNKTNSSNLLAVGTAYKQVRLYDIRSSTTKRRPIAYTSPEGGVLEHRITSLCQTSEYSLVVGDAAGYMHALDIRYMLNNPNPSKKKDGDRRGFIGRYNGPAGSIRQIVKHESLDVLSCVGLDRMVRTYDVKSRKMLDCVYLKQRLNCMLFCEDGLLDLDIGEGEKDGKEVGVYDDAGNYVEGDGEGGDIDQDDVVRDYVDSDDDVDNRREDEDEDETEEDSVIDEVGAEENDEEEGSSQESGENDSEEDGSSSSDGSDSSDDDEEEESEDDESPSKQSRTRKVEKTSVKPKKKMRRS